MEFELKKVGDVAIIVLPGEILDAGNSREFKEGIIPLLENEKKVVFDFGRMHFIGSSGCGAILSCLRRLKADRGELKMCHLSKQVDSLFKLIRLDKILDILKTSEEAVQAFRD